MHPVYFRFTSVSTDQRSFHKFQRLIHLDAHIFNYLAQTLVLVWHSTRHGRFQIAKQGEPNANTSSVLLIERLIVRHRMVVEEQSRGQVERNENIDGVVLVRG